MSLTYKTAPVKVQIFYLKMVSGKKRVKFQIMIHRQVSCKKFTTTKTTYANIA